MSSLTSTACHKRLAEAVDLVASPSTRDLHHVGAARFAELQKLGPNGQARADNVASWFEATLGDDAAILGQVLRRAPVASIITKLEGILNRMNSMGTSSSARPSAGDIEGWENMTYEQRQFAQDQMRR